jgi:hypothetical protein
MMYTQIGSFEGGCEAPDSTFRRELRVGKIAGKLVALLLLVTGNLEFIFVAE